MASRSKIKPRAIIKSVTAPCNWKCAVCGGDIPAGTRCLKGGKEMYCEPCVAKTRKYPK